MLGAGVTVTLFRQKCTVACIFCNVAKNCASIARRRPRDSATPRISAAIILFAQFELLEPYLSEMIHHVHREQGSSDLTMELLGTLLVFNPSKIFRLYQPQVRGKEQNLMQNGLALGTPKRFSGAVKRWLWANLSIHDLYPALSLENMDAEPRLEKGMSQGSAVPFAFQSSKTEWSNTDFTMRN